MRSISLWQPHGSLIITGAKTFETRHWPTSHRGQILLHAAKHWNKESEQSLGGLEYQVGLAPLVGGNIDFTLKRQLHWISKRNLVFGALLGIAELTRCVPTEEMSAQDRRRARGFGNFARGRFAWEMRDVRKFVTPIPFKGAQGMFNAWYDPKATELVEVKPAPLTDWYYCPKCLNNWSTEPECRAGDDCANPDCDGKLVVV